MLEHSNGCHGCPTKAMEKYQVRKFGRVIGEDLMDYLILHNFHIPVADFFVKF